jgi:hypothetical protein
MRSLYLNYGGSRYQPGVEILAHRVIKNLDGQTAISCGHLESRFQLRSFLPAGRVNPDRGNALMAN